MSAGYPDDIGFRLRSSSRPYYSNDMAICNREWQQQPPAECSAKVLPFAVCFRNIVRLHLDSYPENPGENKAKRVKSGVGVSMAGTEHHLTVIRVAHKSN